MTQHKSQRVTGKSRRSRRGFLYTFGLCAVLFATVLSYLHFAGFPDWLLKSFERAMRNSAYWIDASSVKLGVHGELMMEDVRIYRKHIIGPPVADAAEIILKLDPPGLLSRGRLIRMVKISNAVLRPGMFLIEPDVSRRDKNVDMNFRFGLALSKCNVWGINVAEMQGEIVCDEKTMSLKCDEGFLTSGDLNGSIRGTADYAVNDNRLNVIIDAEMHPRMLMPLLNEVKKDYLIQLVNRFEFRGTLPRFRIAVDKKIEEGSVLDIKGEVLLNDFTYRGVDLQKADAGIKIVISPDVFKVTIEPLFLGRSGEGLADVTLDVDLKKEILSFKGISRMNPLAVAVMADVFSEDFLEDFKFGDNVFISASGIVGYKNTSLNDIKCFVKADKLDYKKFPFRDCRVDVEVKGYTNTIKRIAGKLYEGDIVADGVIVSSPTDSGTNEFCNLHWTLKDADFECFMSSDLCGRKNDNYEGILSCKGSINGTPGWQNRKTWKGAGVLKVRKGRVFMLPVFGGLSKYMTKIIPGLDFILRQSDADLDFNFAEGNIDLSNVSIEGSVISLIAAGTCTFEKELDLNIKVTLMKEHTVVGKLLQTLAYPVSKLFEFRLIGTVDEPEWYLENFSSDLLGKLGLTGAGDPEKEKAGMDTDEDGK